MRLHLLGYKVHAWIAALAVIEASLFFLAMYAAVLVRFAGDLAAIELQTGPIGPRAALFSAITFLSCVAFGLYTERQRARTLGLALRITVAVLAGAVATTVVMFLFPTMNMGRGVMVISAIFAVGGACAARALFDRLVDTDMLKRRVLVYGAGSRALAIANLRRRSERLGHVLVGCVNAPGETVSVPADRLIPHEEDLPALCRRLNVDEIVVAMEDRRREFPISDLLECRLGGLDVTDLVSFLERETGRVRVDLMSPGWVIFGGGFRRDTLRRVMARLVDLLASGLIVLLASPVMLLTALAIKLEDGWNSAVFYKQARVGFRGRLFNVLKFRSMRADAERAGQAIWAQQNDPRVTRVGALIRKLRIDELPQILNVLGGHMSFVGPRPERPQFVDELSAKIPYYAQRHTVKPGITGWAQICYPYGASENDSLQKLQYDLYYIKHSSILFNIAILLQTAEVVFMGKGAR